MLSFGRYALTCISWWRRSEAGTTTGCHHSHRPRWRCNDASHPAFRTDIGSPLLLALAVAGCSSADELDAKAAARLLAAVASLEVSSPVFSKKRPRKRIPKESPCYGVNSSPPLDWSGVPAVAEGLAFIVEEPEERLSSASKQSYSFVPSIGSVHWVPFNIPADVTSLPGAIPTSSEGLPDRTVQGINDFGQIGYSGPCPSPSTVAYYDSNMQSADAPREYYFRLYALDAMLDLAPGGGHGGPYAGLRRNDGQVPGPPPAGMVLRRRGRARTQYAHSGEYTVGAPDGYSYAGPMRATRRPGVFPRMAVRAGYDQSRLYSAEIGNVGRDVYQATKGDT